MRVGSIGMAMVLGVLSVAPVAAKDDGSRKTREFVQAAAQSDQFEILEGYTAVTQADSREVRAFFFRPIRCYDGVACAGASSEGVG